MPNLSLAVILEAAVNLANATYGAPQRVRFVFEPNRMDTVSTGFFYNRLISNYLDEFNLHFDSTTDTITPARRVETTFNLIQHMASRIAASRIAGNTRDTNIRSLPINPYNYTVIEEYFRNLYSSEYTEQDVARATNTYISNINTSSLIYGARISTDFVQNLGQTPGFWEGNYFIDADSTVSYFSGANRVEETTYPVETVLLDYIQEEIQYGSNRQQTEEGIDSMYNAIVRNYYRAFGTIVPTTRWNIISRAASLELARRIAPLCSNREELNDVIQHISRNLNEHPGLVA